MGWSTRASQPGNQVAKKISSLHKSFFEDLLAVFNTDQHSEAINLASVSHAASNDHEFDQLNSIESIEGNSGSTIDGRGATAAVEIDLQANSFRTNFFAHTIETIVKGFANALGSHKNDTINGDGKNNILMGLAGNDSLRGDAGDDQILSGDGDDLIQGDAGDDKIDGY